MRFCFSALLFILFCSTASADQPIVVDLSKHFVAVTTGFSGAEVLLFGATDGEPGDVIMVVRGPSTKASVYKKKKISGIWINKDLMSFSGVAGFYRVASSRPIENIISKQDMERLQIGTENLYFQPKDKTASHKKAKMFHKALTRLKNNQGTYNNTVERIVMMENRLFRTELFFPANIPIGTYMVEVYLVRKKRIVSAEITPLIISKTGINAEIYFFAYKYSFLYGILAVLMAVLAGWLVSAVFKKK